MTPTPEQPKAKLLPCPWCGEAGKLGAVLYNRPCVVCPSCDANGPSAQRLRADIDNRKEAAAEAIVIWNTRAESAELARLRVELEQANARIEAEMARGEQWCRDFISAKKALRQAGDCFTRIEDTRFGYDGDCGVVGIANEGNEIINKALNP